MCYFRFPGIRCYITHPLPRSIPNQPTHLVDPTISQDIDLPCYHQSKLIVILVTTRRIAELCGWKWLVERESIPKWPNLLSEWIFVIYHKFIKLVSYYLCMYIYILYNYIDINTIYTITYVYIYIYTYNIFNAVTRWDNLVDFYPPLGIEHFMKTARAWHRDWWWWIISCGEWPLRNPGKSPVENGGQHSVIYTVMAIYQL